jgi:hypothetical protein
VLFGPRRTSRKYTENKYLFPFFLLRDPFLVDRCALIGPLKCHVARFELGSAIHTQGKYLFAQFTVRIAFVLRMFHLFKIELRSLPP